MTTLSWNYRGLGNSKTVRELLGLVSKFKPNFIFLMEVKVSRDKVERLRSKIQYQGLCFIPGINNGGGLAFLLRDRDTTNLLGYSSNFIEVTITLKDMGQWRLTGYYGFPERQRRSDSWNLLRELSHKSSLPWCCVGDFNDLLAQSEKQGRLPHPVHLINGFREAVTDCNLLDLGMKGHLFTWEKSRGTVNFTEERLDRIFATQQWVNFFPKAEVINVPVLRSDHSALVLHLTSEPVHRKCRFRFENGWRFEPACKDVITTSWGGQGQIAIKERIRSCSSSLQEWGESVRRRFRSEIAACRSTIRAFTALTDLTSQQRVLEERARLNNLLRQQASYWAQRAKVFWLREGDVNSKTFHSYASARKRKNSISYLIDDDGRKCEWDNGLQDLIIGYFSDLFESNGSDAACVLSAVRTKITDSQNQSLVRIFTATEVEEAMKCMHPDKSPGPDGFNPGFYQTYWTEVGPAVTEACLECLNECKLPDGLNDTVIVLIPKVKKSEKISDLRPISLCNVIVKIMTKMLANRLKLVLNSIISESQSAFIPGRLITDNVMVAFEVGHYINRKTRGKTGVVSLKIDMSKAYDRVEWGFLESMTRKMGFCDKMD